MKEMSESIPEVAGLLHSLEVSFSSRRKDQLWNRRKTLSTITSNFHQIFEENRELFKFSELSNLHCRFVGLKKSSNFASPRRSRLFPLRSLEPQQRSLLHVEAFRTSGDVSLASNTSTHSVVHRLIGSPNRRIPDCGRQQQQQQRHYKRNK